MSIKEDWKKSERDICKVYTELAPSWLKKRIEYSFNKDYAEATKKFARGMTFSSGTRHNQFDSEAAVYVWHEKNVLKLPKWLTGTSFNTGHGALKLTRYDPNKQKPELVRYFSWWPGSEANKSDDAAPGGLTENTGVDRMNEMTRDEDIQLLVKMQLISKALIDTAGGADEFEELCKLRWLELAPGDRKRLKDKFNVGEFFINLANSKLQAKANQKLVDFVKAYKDPHSGGYSKNVIPTTNVAETLNTNFDGIFAAKQPYCKVYIPCSTPPVPIYDTERYQRSTIWGLSMHAMQLACRFFEEGVTPYKMQDFHQNCIGAVWTVLKAGLAGSITQNFKPTKGVVENLAHYRSLLPSDGIKASIAVMDDVLRRTQQQFFLDTHAQRHRVALNSLSSRNQCFGRDWRLCLVNSVWWRDFSNASGLRSQGKKKVDSIQAEYARIEGPNGSKDGYDAAWMLKIEELWKKHIADREEYKNTISELKEARAKIKQKAKYINIMRRAMPHLQAGKQYMFMHPDDLPGVPAEIEKEKKAIQIQRKKDLMLKEKLNRIEQRVKSNTKNWEAKLESFETTRQAKARKLGELHDAIFQYIHSCGKHGMSNPDRRYLTTLLLGQFVSWMYVEVADPNMKIGFHGLNERGFIITHEERDERLRVTALKQQKRPPKTNKKHS
jgi:hypothetical protein